MAGQDPVRGNVSDASLISLILLAGYLMTPTRWLLLSRNGCGHHLRHRLELMPISLDTLPTTATIPILLCSAIHQAYYIPQVKQRNAVNGIH